MRSPEQIENTLKKLAKSSFEEPGIYLIALRAHLNRGKAIIRHLDERVRRPFSKRSIGPDDQRFNLVSP